METIIDISAIEDARARKNSAKWRTSGSCSTLLSAAPLTSLGRERTGVTSR